MSVVIVECEGSMQVIEVGKGDMGDVTPAATAALFGAQAAQQAAQVAAAAVIESAAEALSSKASAADSASQATGALAAVAANAAAALASQQSAASHDASATGAAAAALQSQNSAATHDTAAGLSAASASASQVASAASQVAAHTSEVNAGVSAASAAQVASSLSAGLAAFNRYYLGEHAADPTIDNQGGALVEGATYFNTTLNPKRTRIYLSGAWADQSADAETATSNAQLASTSAAAAAAAAAASQQSAAAHDTSATGAAAAALASQTSAAAHDTSAGQSAATATAQAGITTTQAAAALANAQASAANAAAAAGAVSGFSRVTNTVISGAVDTLGLPAFITAAGMTLSLVASAAAPLVTAYGAGPQADCRSALTAPVADIGVTPILNGTTFIQQNYGSGTAATFSGTRVPPRHGRFFDRTRQSLLRFEGANNALSSLCDYGNGFTYGGAIKLTTASSKFGGSSLQMGVAGSYMDYVTPPTIDIGTGFTIDFWLNQDGAQPAYSRPFCAPLTVGGNDGMQFFFNYNSVNQAALYMAGNVVTTGTSALVTGAWIHYAICWDPITATYYVYQAGVKIMQWAAPVPLLFNQFRLGGWTSGSGYEFNGKMDEFRFRSYCAYPAGATFAPPTASASVEGDFYNDTTSTMYSITGPATAVNTDPVMSPVTRTYCSEVVCSGAAITSVINYAFRGYYDSGWFLALTNQTYNKNHNLGPMCDAAISLYCADYLRGDNPRPIPFGATYYDGTGNYGCESGLATRNSQSFSTYNEGVALGTIGGQSAAAYRLVAHRRNN
jgi:hypothetical protein